MTHLRGARRLSVVVAAAALLVTACSASAEEDLVPTGRDAAASADAAPSAATPVVDSTIATDLAAPWSVAFLPDGSALVSERDTANVVHLTPAGDGTWSSAEAGGVTGVDNTGEGGLMGLAVAPLTDGSASADPSGTPVYVYWSTATDNRVGVANWDGTQLSQPEVILDGIPHAGIHNGGRIAIGPDGMLYIGTGDAGASDSAQDPTSLAGKVLRINPDGSIPADNPDPTSPVYSLGHRNIQGLAFDDAGQLWASEFGASDVDELNLIVAGGNYGWPIHEGAADDPNYLNPAAQWSPTAVASPSGIAISDGSAWVAGLRGATLWQVPIDGTTAGQPIPRLTEEFGRLRDVVKAPDGSLWLVTNNTDGRGDPKPGDDRIVRLSVTGSD